MNITRSHLRRIIKEELEAATKEGVLDREVQGRKPSGAPMTAQARQDILDGYVAYVEEHMPNVSREAALKSAIDLFVDGGDPYLDQASDYFDQSLYNKVVGKEPLGEARPAGNAPRHKYIGKNVKKDGKSGRVTAMRDGVLSIQFKDGTQVRTRADSPGLEFLK